MIVDQWNQLERYLQTLETRAGDARAGLSRIILEPLGSPLVLPSIPHPSQMSPSAVSLGANTMPPPAHLRYNTSSSHQLSRSTSSRMFAHTSLSSLPLPQLSNSNQAHNNASSSSRGVRRRAGSMDGVPGQPPSKKSRGDRLDRRGRDDRPSFQDSVRTFPLILSVILPVAYPRIASTTIENKNNRNGRWFFDARSSWFLTILHIPLCPWYASIPFVFSCKRSLIASLCLLVLSVFDYMVVLSWLLQRTRPRAGLPGLLVLPSTPPFTYSFGRETKKITQPFQKVFVPRIQPLRPQFLVSRRDAHSCHFG